MTEPLRIAMVGPFGLRPKGTMAVRALPLAQALAERGHAVKLIMPPWHTPNEPARIWREGAVELEYVALGPLADHASAPWTTRRLVQAARAWQPDVVHGFKPKAYAGLSMWALWQQRVRGPGAGAAGGRGRLGRSRRLGAARALYRGSTRAIPLARALGPGAQ